MYIRVENKKVTGVFWDEDISEELKSELIQVSDIPMSPNNHSELCFDGNVFYYVDISEKETNIEELPQDVLKSIKKENEELKKQVESTQQGMAEIMNLIAMQGITP